MRNNLGLARSPLDSRLRGNDIGEGVRRLACFRWRSQRMPRVRALQLQRS